MQHAEKERSAGDPAITELGWAQAAATAAHLRSLPIARVLSSPLLRARQTAEPIAVALGLPVELDRRLRERMNWGGSPSPQTLEEFLADWARATRERDFQPPSGDSSRGAGERFAALLRELAVEEDGSGIALVTHGGVTVDLLRTLFGDAHLRERHPTLIEDGVPACAITHLTRREGGFELGRLADVGRLAGVAVTSHRA